MKPKIKVLFLCTGNSCRSQMAEGLCRHYRGDMIDAYSAGIEKHGLNPLAVKAMGEIGIDITSQTSKTLDDLEHADFDYVVTVCGNAKETCPVFPARIKLVHAGFDDPPKLAKDARDEAEAMVPYRRVRDEIKAFIQELPSALNSG